ncbi:MAG: hypothetical protein ACP5QO_05555 [Clostridia bacterium]
MVGDVSLPERAPVSVWRQMTWWILVLPTALGVALITDSRPILDYTHVMAGALWTGADLLLGFIVGPVMRRLTLEQRRAVITFLTPRTLLYMPVVAFTTGTAGWFLANQMGYWPSSPDRGWIIGALIVTTVLAIQGFGIILPNNLRILKEGQKDHPDAERLARWNRMNLVLAGVQGALQVVIIAIMVHLAVG